MNFSTKHKFCFYWLVHLYHCQANHLFRRGGEERNSQGFLANLKPSITTATTKQVIENHIAPNSDTHAGSFGPMSGSPDHKPEQCFKLRPHVVERAPGDIQLEIKSTTMAGVNT